LGGRYRKFINAAFVGIGKKDQRSPDEGGGEGVELRVRKPAERLDETAEKGQYQIRENFQPG